MPSQRRQEGLLFAIEARVEKPMLALSAIWLVLLIVELAGRAPDWVSTASTAIWAIFIAEFLLRLAIAPNKLRFLATNVITILALLVPAFRLFRGLRALRLVRGASRGGTLVRVIGGANRAMNTIARAMGRRGLGFVLVLTVIVALLGALGMRAFESSGPNADAFNSFGDSLWWTAMILTTMGSQAWPATPEGRFLAFLLSFYAFAVFGYVAASFASIFVDKDRREEPSRDTHEVARLREEIAALREEVRRLHPPA